MRRFAFVLVLTVGVPLFAQESAPMVFSRDPVGVKSYPAAPRVLQAASLAPAAMLGPADPADVAEVEEWNARGRLPMKNGFRRSFPERLDVHLTTATAAKAAVSHAGGIVTTDARGLVWGAAFTIEKASRVRLHLENVHLPEGAVLWVYGGADEPTAFDRDLIDPNGSLWTPSVHGPTVHLELEIPAPKSDADGASFVIREAMELVGSKAPVQLTTEDVPSCLIDANCRTSQIADNLRAAIAHLEYVKDGSGYVCSGGLVNDNVPAPSFVPYLLTANHCFDSQASASSLEAFWDYRTSSCGALLPSCCGSTRTLGATLLATGASSDFTFVRLNSLPAGRVLLGWTTQPQSNGTNLYRVSHPFPDAFDEPAPQMYSRTLLNTTFVACSAKPRPNFVYSSGGEGGLYGGSSGSPVVLESGQIVGQLFGACGPDPSAGCDVRNATVDGSFASTYPFVAQFVSTDIAPACTTDATTACLSGGRFGVKVSWKTSSATGQATAIKYTADSAFFWFFNAENIELFAKVLNGCPLNSRYWVFGAAATDVEYTITVTDTKNGTVKNYFHAGGAAAPAITDTNAFATCP
jgi:lysyl endopeptidase